MAGFVTEVESGDRMRALVALRRELAIAIEAGRPCPECGAPAPGPEAKDLAALSLRLERVLEQIDAAGGATTEEHDDLAAKRHAKLSAASGP